MQIKGDKLLRHEFNAAKLREVRRARGFTLWQLCMHVHKATGFLIYPQTLSSWERGAVYPTEKRLEILAKALDLKSEDFYL